MMADLGLDMGPHAAFIWGAYGAVAAVLAMLTAWVLADEWRQRRLIAQLEAQGVTRRSARATDAGPRAETGKPAGKPKRAAPKRQAARKGSAAAANERTAGKGAAGKGAAGKGATAKRSPGARRRARARA